MPLSALQLPSLNSWCHSWFSQPLMGFVFSLVCLSSEMKLPYSICCSCRILFYCLVTGKKPNRKHTHLCASVQYHASPRKKKHLCYHWHVIIKRKMKQAWQMIATCLIWVVGTQVIYYFLYLSLSLKYFINSIVIPSLTYVFRINCVISKCFEVFQVILLISDIPMG